MYVCGDLPQTRLFDKIVSRHMEKYLWQTEGERQNKREEKKACRRVISDLKSLAFVFICLRQRPI